jgi:D-amino peptidase
MEGGASLFLANDAHSKMSNLRPDALASSASYLSGRFKPMYMMQALAGSFDAILFVSYHGSMGSNGFVLSHTYFPQAFVEVTVNGIPPAATRLDAGLCALQGRR